MKKVLQITFSGSWNRGGCLPQITRAWVRHSKRYEHYFASSAGEAPGEIGGRPHYGFLEDARANRIYNKILRQNRFSYFSLIPIIEKIRPDILHIHNRHDLVDQLVAKLSYRPKVVCIYHRSYNVLFVPATADLLIGVGKFIVHWLYRKADPVAPLAVLHNPFRIIERPVVEPAKKPLFLTYITDRAPTRHLFTAVETLRAEGFDFEVKAFGTVYRDLAPPPGVTVSGYVEQEEFLKIQTQASAYICLTYGTAFSVAVMEAIALRTPVICPWDIGALDLLPPDAVISFESHSAVAMTNALRTFLTMPETARRTLADRAFAAASTVYDEARLTERLETLYDSLDQARSI